MRTGIRSVIIALLAVAGGAMVAFSSVLMFETAKAETSGQVGVDNIVVAVGHTVAIGSAATADAAWESMTGGSLRIEYGDASVGTDQFHTTTPGHKSISTVTLRGPVVSGSASGTFTSLFVDSLGSAMPAATIEGEIHENGAGRFAIEIDGLATFSNNIVSIEIEPLTIDVRDLTTGLDFDYRQFGPGDVHLGTMTLAASKMQGETGANDWWQDAADGANEPRNISVTALTRDGSEGRRWDFLDCVPVTYHPFSGFSAGSAPVLETLTVACGRVELSGGRTEMAQWINATIQGSTWQRDVAITQILLGGTEGTVYRYIDAFPAKYVFPSFSAHGTGSLYEEISFKPIRLEID